MKKPIRFILYFFVICLVLRLADSFILRTDQGPLGELFTHKLLGIALLVFVLHKYGMKWADIGFRKSTALHGILGGIVLGGGAFVIAYAAEMLINFASGASPVLRFYTTSYNVTGNTILQNGAALVAICVLGNIINVIMEDGVFRGLFITLAEKHYGFWKACLFAALLFGVWHGVMPLRNFVDGEQSLHGALMSALMLFITSAIFAVQLGMQFKMSHSLWYGMTVHFINNASVNLLHVITANGADNLLIMRITIAQAIMFIVVLIRFIYKGRL
jgi:membrane protease YdiL (CAAX protease family)